jgi:SAM-dependent methyltransferase
MPERHVDVGSLHMTIAMLSRVVPVTMVDLRPLPVSLDGLDFRQGSILAMPFEDASVPSVSSLCVVEHIGLGRYGDSLDPYGTEKALLELKRIVAHGGDLYVSFPIGAADAICFNAHRILSESRILDLMRPFELVEARYLDRHSLVCRRPEHESVGCYHFRRATVEL